MTKIPMLTRIGDIAIAVVLLCVSTTAVGITLKFMLELLGGGK